MADVNVRLVMGRGIPSGLISWFGGDFSHADAIMPDGTLLGARSDSIPDGYPRGVQKRPGPPKPYENVMRSVTFTLSSTDQQAKDFYGFLIEQIGKPYDKTAIIAFALDRDWREQDSWFCSELIAAALEVSGLCPKLYLADSKITPGHLALVLSALRATVS